MSLSLRVKGFVRHGEASDGVSSGLWLGTSWIE